jgi:surfeit locus 1 family protein
MSNRRFRPTWWGTLLAVLGIAAGIHLGLWQTGRAQQKMQMADAMAQRASAPIVHVGAQLLPASDLEYRTVEARGRFDVRGLVLLDNHVYKGRVGYEVIMPLEIADSGVYLLVDRGWIAGTGDRNHLPQITTPDGVIQVTGVAVVPGKKIYELSSSSTIEGKVWQNLSVERYVERMRYTAQPVLVRQSNDVADGLIRDWTVSDREINVHRSYAFQWFALAGLVFVIYLVMSFKRDTFRS